MIWLQSQSDGHISGVIGECSDGLVGLRRLDVHGMLNHNDVPDNALFGDVEWVDPLDLTDCQDVTDGLRRYWGALPGRAGVT